MNRTIPMHQARTMLNRDSDLRQWAEEWLKQQEHARFMSQPEAKAEEFERHWKFVRPERMHEEAVAAVEAYMQRQAERQ